MDWLPESESGHAAWAPLLAAIAVAGLAPAVAAQIADVTGLCEDRQTVTGPSVRGSALGRPASDLHCIDLLSTALAAEARGVVELGRVATPFGVAVTSDGHQLRALTAWLEGLPDPSALGPYSTYVAWATPLTMSPLARLGEVRNGRNELGRISFNKYLVLISAEASPDVEEREGPLILRGRSPSSLMEAHDLLAQAPAGTQPSAGGAGRTDWEPPPAYAGVPILPGLMGLTPRASPWLVAADAAVRLPLAERRQLVELPDGGTLDLEARLVRKEINGRMLLLMAFNGQHPGPLIKVTERSTIFVNFTNRTPLPTSVHWHGVRLDNRFDGVPGVTQDPVQPGDSFRYQIFFRDAGIYWYHPHHREDIQQELGLYGNMLVESVRPDYFGPVNREEILMLDDLLLAAEGAVPFGDESANYMLMGRFGNVPLVNGEPAYELEVDRGEVVRFFLTNVSNTRTFNLSFVPAGAAPRAGSGLQREAPGSGSETRPLPMKVVASDVGRFEREEHVESAVLGPAERYVVEVRFVEPGDYALVNHVQGINHRMGVFQPEIATLGAVRVLDRSTAHDHTAAFETLRENADVVAEIDGYRPQFDRPVDHELIMTLEVEDLPLPIEQSMRYDWIYFNPVEWTGTMPMMNWATTGREIRWLLRDPATGRENDDIDWRFAVGDIVKIRVHNDRDAFHAMQHPLHIHGQRFLVVSQNGVPTENLVWKDTVLLPAGSTTDILLELSNPGRWMVHCHIAEHLESGMKLVMEVEP